MSDLATAQNTAQTGYDIGVKQYREPARVDPEGRPFAVVPDGLDVLDMERYLPKPTAIRQTHQFYDADSFGRYVKDFGGDRTQIFASLGEGQIAAVLDYHLVNEPSWNEHTATLVAEKTDDWNDWMAHNERPISQVDFAQFLEDHAHNVVEPESALVLQVVTNLEANKAVVFKSGVNLGDGSFQLTYNENVNDQTQGTIKIPKSLVLGIEPYKGTVPYEVRARLRFRIDSNGRLTFAYLLDRPDRVLEDAFRKLVKAVETQTSITPYLTA